MTDVDGAARNPDLAYRVNALGTRNVAVASEAIGAALLAISTNEVFDGAKTEPYLEFDPTNPINPYAKSKLAAEAIRARSDHPFLYCTDCLAVRFGRQQLRQEDHHSRRHAMANCASSPTKSVRPPTPKISSPPSSSSSPRARMASITSPTTAPARATSSRRRFWSSAAAPTSRSSRSCSLTIRAPRRRRPVRPLRNFCGAQIGITLRPWADALADYLAHEQF